MNWNDERGIERPNQFFISVYSFLKSRQFKSIRNEFRECTPHHEKILFQRWVLSFYVPLGSNIIEI